MCQTCCTRADLAFRTISKVSTLMQTLWFLLVLLLFAACNALEESHNPTATDLVFQNFAGKDLMLYWKNPGTGELVPQLSAALKTTGSQKINSYTTHEFVVTEPGMTFGGGLNNSFHVGELHGHAIARLNQAGAVELEYFDHLTQAMDSLKAKIVECGSEEGVLSTSNEEDMQCVAEHVEEHHRETALDLKLERALKKRLSKQMRKYVCADTSLKTTPAMSSSSWAHEGKSYRYSNVFRKGVIQIKVLDDFVSEEECQQLMKRAEGRMQRASVTGENGKPEIAQARKAYAASVDPKHDGSDILGSLQERIYAFTNSMTGYNLPLEGQEGFSVIKYDPNGDEYTEHCDGACDGTHVQVGGRVATMVLYCRTAEKGGQTTFLNSDVIVVPKKGQASFFSYMNEDRTMDEGALTEHSGCPILEGQKWIATMWMRHGVSKESPWSEYTPQGTVVRDKRN